MDHRINLPALLRLDIIPRPEAHFEVLDRDRDISGG